MSDDSLKTERVHCNACGQDTKHFVITTRVQRGSEHIHGEFTINWSHTYDMLECCGCETVCLRKTYWFSEDPEDERVEFFPPEISRRKPRWVDSLPYEVQTLLEEVYIALHADSRRLAMMGARALVDIVMQQKVGDIGGFVQKLDALEKGGYLSTRNREVLEAALNAGHAAAHRGHTVSAEEAEHVMDIVENLLHTDPLEAAAQSLKKTVPPRDKRDTPRQSQ